MNIRIVGIERLSKHHVSNQTKNYFKSLRNYYIQIFVEIKME